MSFPECFRAAIAEAGLLCAGDMQAMLNHPGSVLPALRFGMNLQMVHQQPQLPVEAPFRILTTCSWEQNAYTVKIYVPLQGVKTDLLRAVFQPDTLHIKAINLQVSSFVSHLDCAILQAYAVYLVTMTASSSCAGLARSCYAMRFLAKPSTVNAELSYSCQNMCDLC